MADTLRKLKDLKKIISSGNANQIVLAVAVRTLLEIEIERQETGASQPPNLSA